MSSLSREQVEHVAHLARLDLTEAEVEKARIDLAAILTYVEQLQELDTSGVEATLGVQPHGNVFRDDVPRESFPHEQILANAPHPQDGAFRIPRILEES